MSISHKNFNNNLSKDKKRLNGSITVRVDREAKEKFEEICSDMHMTISDAINAFINKVNYVRAMPFAINGVKRKRKLGIAEGKYKIPDDINIYDDEIVEMFGV